MNNLNAQNNEFENKHSVVKKYDMSLNSLKTRIPNSNVINMAADHPTKDNQRLLRDAFGQFGTGVTIVTAQNEQSGPLGITVNSFASVSLDPALVLWSMSKKSSRHSTFASAQHYAIHILNENQKDLALSFAQNPQSLDQCDWASDHNNVPIIKNTLARFDCTQTATHEGGDHTIIVGQVMSFEQQNGQPLIFATGSFGRFER